MRRICVLRKKKTLTQIWGRKPADNKKCWVKHSLIFLTDWNKFTLLYMNQLTERCINLSLFFQTRLQSATNIVEAIPSMTPTYTEWAEDSDSISTESFHVTHHYIKRRHFTVWRLKLESMGLTYFILYTTVKNVPPCFLNLHIIVTLLVGYLRTSGASNSPKSENSSWFQNAKKLTIKPNLTWLYQRERFLCFWSTEKVTLRQNDSVNLIQQ